MFNRIAKFVFSFISIFWFGLVLLVVFFTISSNSFWDFNVFYSSAENALQGENIYRLYGARELPYWYFPWTSWLFIPFTLLSFDNAKILFLILSLFSLYYIIRSLLKYFNHEYHLSLQLFIFSNSLVICWLLFKAGQSDFMLTALAVFAMFLIAKNHQGAAGFLFPILLFKPHLIAIFILLAIYKGGKKFFFSFLLSLLILSIIAFFLQPNWPLEMVRMASLNGQRTDNNWDFMTLSELVGLNENWLGTKNLPLVVVIFLISTYSVVKFRHLPTMPLLIFSLSASMVSAPRAYSYNLPFILPSVIWLSNNKPGVSILLFAILGTIAFLSGFSTWSYLIVIIAYLLSLLKLFFDSRALEIDDESTEN